MQVQVRRGVVLSPASAGRFRGGNSERLQEKIFRRDLLPPCGARCGSHCAIRDCFRPSPAGSAMRMDFAPAGFLRPHCAGCGWPLRHIRDWSAHERMGAQMWLIAGHRDGSAR